MLGSHLYKQSFIRAITQLDAAREEAYEMDITFQQHHVQGMDKLQMSYLLKNKCNAGVLIWNQFW